MIEVVSAHAFKKNKNQGKKWKRHALLLRISIESE
jgi:hypothetical protein